MLCLTLTAVLLLFLAACGNSPKQAIEAPTVPQNQDASTTEPEVTQGNAASESSHRFLIAYFTAAENSDVDAVSSASVVTVDGAPKGRVQALAEIIQRDTGGDLFSIRTSTVYPGDGGKFEDFAAEEQNAKARPELATRIENLDAYDVIFVGYRPLGKPNFITQHFDILLAKNKLEKIRFHDLRHSCASLLYANGVSLKEIQEWMGHSDISTTSNIYTYLDFSSKVSSANAILPAFPKNVQYLASGQ